MSRPQNIFKYNSSLLMGNILPSNFICIQNILFFIGLDLAYKFEQLTQRRFRTFLCQIEANEIWMFCIQMKCMIHMMEKAIGTVNRENIFSFAYLQGAPKSSSTLYYLAKRMDAIALKFSAVSANTIQSLHAISKISIFYQAHQSIMTP